MVTTGRQRNHPDPDRTALGLPPADGSRFDTVLMGWHTYAAGLADGSTPRTRTSGRSC
jgi:hypothetical protein